MEKGASVTTTLFDSRHMNICLCGESQVIKKTGDYDSRPEMEYLIGLERGSKSE